MGDRANIVLKQHGGKSDDIWIYTHNGGHDLPGELQSALKHARSRWNDESYLGRMIFSYLIRDDVMRQTGFGISTYMCDEEGNRRFYVDSSTQKVTVNNRNGTPGKVLTFEEFCALDNPTWGMLRDESED